MLPKISKVIAELYCYVVQHNSMAYFDGKYGVYIMPFRPSKDLADIEALFNSIAGEYDAVVWATQMGHAFERFDYSFINSVRVTPIASHFGLNMCFNFPFEIENAGAQQSFSDIDETWDLYWVPALGIPEFYDALPFYRNSMCADEPKIITVHAAAADKLAAEDADIGDSAFADIANTATTLDWMYHAATARSATHTGMYTGTGIHLKSNVLSGPASFDLKAALWMVKHFEGSPVPNVMLHSVLPDFVKVNQGRGY